MMPYLASIIAFVPGGHNNIRLPDKEPPGHAQDATAISPLRFCKQLLLAYTLLTLASLLLVFATG